MRKVQFDKCKRLRNKVSSTSKYLISVNSLHLDMTGASKNKNSDTKDLDELAISYSNERQCCGGNSFTLDVVVDRVDTYKKCYNVTTQVVIEKKLVANVVIGKATRNKTGLDFVRQP